MRWPVGVGCARVNGTAWAQISGSAVTIISDYAIVTRRPIHLRDAHAQRPPLRSRNRRSRRGGARRRPRAFRQPQFRTWSLDEAEGGIYAGIWEATPGSWRIVYEEWEYFSILSGYSIVTEDGGEAHHLRAGDRMVLKPGFSGSWEVIETTRKDYVVRL